MEDLRSAISGRTIELDRAALVDLRDVSLEAGGVVNQCSRDWSQERRFEFMPLSTDTTTWCPSSFSASDSSPPCVGSPSEGLASLTLVSLELYGLSRSREERVFSGVRITTDEPAVEDEAFRSRDVELERGCSAPPGKAVPDAGV